MFDSVRKWSALRVFLIVALLLSSVVVAGFAAYSLQFMSVPLEVKEPFEILDYPTSFSLYPGENVTFEVTVQNSAPVIYFAEFDFHLNDTEYQASYGIFSNFNYSVAPGTQKLAAWLTIASTAPPANLTLTIDLKTVAPSPTPSPTTSPTESPTPSPTPSLTPSPTPFNSSSPEPSPTPSNSSTPSPSPTPSPTPSNQTELNPSLKLLGAGAKWAAGNGTKALYINWKDNWAAHHLTDGTYWDWVVSESVFENRKSMILSALEQSGLEVVCAGDIPNDLSNYSLVVLEAYYAIEPRHEPLIRQYISNGSGIVFISGTACYLTTYSKSMSVGTNLATIRDWLGCSRYVNAGGTARVITDHPFGTQLLNGDTVYFTAGGGAAGFTGLGNGTKVIARWESDVIFSFTHEYGNGRVYYQVHWEGN